MKEEEEEMQIDLCFLLGIKISRVWKGKEIEDYLQRENENRFSEGRGSRKRRRDFGDFRG